MSRHNRLTQMAFGDITGTDSKISKFMQFLSTDEALGIDETQEIKECKKLYNKLISKYKKEFEELAKLEEVIVQLRCRETVMDDFKLSRVREYIYARALFYRPEKDIKDIRVVVGRTDVFGEDMEALMKDENFLAIASKKLKDAMSIEIQDNLSYVETLKEKYNSK